MTVQELQKEILSIIHSGKLAHSVCKFINKSFVDIPQLKIAIEIVTKESNVDVSGLSVKNAIQQLDLSALLRISELYAKNNRGKFVHGRQVINMFRAMRDIRNRWSHQSAVGIIEDKISKDLSNIIAFLEAVESTELLQVANSLSTHSVIQNNVSQRIQLLPNMPRWTELDDTQRKVVNKKFKSTVMLNGVSGSGKTSILIHKAIALADNEPSLPILIVTLNKPLAQLIDSLLNEVIDINSQTRKSISVTSMFQLCQEILIKMNPGNEKLYTDVTYGPNKQHVDDIWREFYRCEVNNNDAYVLFQLHKELNSRSISGESYIKQEFDLIRSEFPINRNEYYSYPRIGRVVNFNHEHRKNILFGLSKWEEKMKAVGVIDHIGLAHALYLYKMRLTQKYSHVLVDECQDFGTVELGILRCIVSDGPEDIFLFGDKAQSVTYKHQDPIKSGLDIKNNISLNVNRRNTVEILEASDAVLRNSVASSPFLNRIIAPQPSVISHLKPIVCHTEDNEIAYAISYVNTCRVFNPSLTACVVIAGYSWHEISLFAQTVNFSVLDSDTEITSGSTFVSDLEQTKGFEFDLVIICCCNENVLPNRSLPQSEIDQQASRLYVAMTRARFDLVISHKGILSKWIQECILYFEKAKWSDITELQHIKLSRKYPKKMPQLTDNPNFIVMDMTAKQFLYSDYAVGMPLSDQNELLNFTLSNNNFQSYTISNILQREEILRQFSFSLRRKLISLAEKFKFSSN